MPRRKVPARSRLEIGFESNGERLAFEGEVGFDFPGPEFRGVWRGAFVVGFQTGTEIGCVTNVALIGSRKGTDDVGVEHSASPCGPPLPRLRRTTNLRSFCASACQP